MFTDTLSILKTFFQKEICWSFSEAKLVIVKIFRLFLINEDLIEGYKDVA